MRTLHRNTLIGMLSVATALLVGCGGFRQTNQLVGTTWELRSVGSEFAIPDQRPIVTFESDSRLNGHTRCNSFSGQYSAGREDFEASQISTTLMACVEPAVNDQEAAFLKALGDARRYVVTADDRTLTLYSDDGRILMVMAPNDPVE